MMRISTQSQINIMNNAATTSMSTQQKLATQFTTKKRVNVPSDNPIASAMFRQLESENLKLEQYGKNAVNVKNNITIQEVNIESVSDLMTSIKNSIIKSQLPSNGPDDIKTYAKEIETKMNSLVDILNKKNMEGRYLYSGTKTDTQPVTYNTVSQKYAYNGNNVVRDIIVAEGVTEKEGAQLNQVFAIGSEPMKVLSDLRKLYTELKTGVITTATSANIQSSMAAVENAASQLDTISGDLINRKEKLDVLQTTQQQMKASNAEFGKSLVGLTDIEQGMLHVELQKHQLVLNATMKMHIKMSQFSIFNLMS